MLTTDMRRVMHAQVCAGSRSATMASANDEFALIRIRITTTVCRYGTKICCAMFAETLPASLKMENSAKFYVQWRSGLARRSFSEGPPLPRLRKGAAGLV